MLATVSTPTKAGYTTTARVMAAGEQLTKAAVRLANLLKVTDQRERRQRAILRAVREQDRMVRLGAQRLLEIRPPRVAGYAQPTSLMASRDLEPEIERRSRAAIPRW